MTAWSSAAAERGVSQRPKARNAPRSSGAPASGGSVPTSSGFLFARPDDDALVAQVEHRLGALQRRVEVGDSCRAALFSSKVRARSRISQIAESSAAPMTPERPRPG